MLAGEVTGRQTGLDHCRYFLGDAFGRELQRRLRWLSQRHCLIAERMRAGWSESPESEVAGVWKHHMGSTRRWILFAGAATGVHWLIEDRTGSHPVQCLVVRRDWNEEGMARTGKWWHHEVVDLGSDEEEKSPLLPGEIPCSFGYVKGGEVLSLPCMRIGQP